MLKLAKYAAVAAVAGGLGVAATNPASAWGYADGDYGYDDYNYGYSFSPYAYGSTYRHGYSGYRPFYRHHFDGFYGPGRSYRDWGW